MKPKILLRAVIIPFICLQSLHLWAENSAVGSDASSTNQNERFSDKIIFRPSIVPVGIINVDANVALKKLKTVSFDLASQFGIVKDLQGEVSFDGMEFNQFKLHKVVNFAAKYFYLNLPHTAFSVSAKLPVHIADGEIIKDVTFGLPIVFYNDIMAGSILGNLFNLQMRQEVEATFNFPFWYGVQVYDKWWTAIDSSFGRIHMDNAKNQADWKAHGFWQVLPANLSVIYVINHYVDLGANFGFDDTLKAKDTIKFGLTLSARAGRLFE